ncbi:iron-containing alcohol dehydrogenase [Diaphorobacter sp. HDW4A]|uniref:iron-containing alcohol dehydrogenase n=1 Tax=Diaphorobacter sp. HDW4A TaxID=2714924 RepID=UPI00140AE9D0|nr:iron-containing alcohol dehydrogenase [Diaphorobacter sp. HDW4A]QIL79796.1 iron-containing alcohol dehydrogenase [Diaphorobacter sp. HDW4A]
MNTTQSAMSASACGMYRNTVLERVVHGQPFEQAAVTDVIARGVKRVLVIASPRASDTATLASLESALGGHHAASFCGALPHAPTQCVMEGAALARRLRADHLIAIGGGSVIDTAKAVAYALSAGDTNHSSVLLDAPDAGSVDPGSRQWNASEWLGVTAIPQTLSAAEYTWFAGVSDPERKIKKIVAHPAMAPRTVILDPRLTLEFALPTFLASGIKAVDHAVERLTALHSHPISDALSIHALGMLLASLPAVHSAPGDLEARLQCQLASWLSIAGGSAGVRTGASHALGHVLGAHAGVDHGLTSCALLPSVLRWNLTHNRAQQARVLSGLGQGGDVLAPLISQCIARLGLPTRLRDIGVPSSDLAEVAEKSLHDPGMRHNPRPVRSAADALEILEMAW